MTIEEWQRIWEENKELEDIILNDEKGYQMEARRDKDRLARRNFS